MDESVITIFGYAFHGWQAKAVLLVALGSIFASGWVLGYRMGVDEVANAVEKKIDSLKTKE